MPSAKFGAFSVTDRTCSYRPAYHPALYPVERCPVDRAGEPHQPQRRGTRPPVGRVHQRSPGADGTGPIHRLGHHARHYDRAPFRRSTRSPNRWAPTFSSVGGLHLSSFGGKSLAEDFGLLVDVLADVLRNPTFPPAEVEKMRGQIITSLKELEDDTRGLAGREFRRLLYTDRHPYGRPGDGTLDSVPGIKRDDLVQVLSNALLPDRRPRRGGGRRAGRGCARQAGCRSWGLVSR